MRAELNAHTCSIPLGACHFPAVGAVVRRSRMHFGGQGQCVPRLDAERSANGLGIRCVLVGLCPISNSQRLVGGSAWTAACAGGDCRCVVGVYGANIGSKFVVGNVGGPIRIWCGRGGRVSGNGTSHVFLDSDAGARRRAGHQFFGFTDWGCITLPLISWFIYQLGWRTTFLILMVVGLAWAVLWFVLFRDDPADADWLDDAERGYILSHRQQASEQLADAASDSPAASGLWRQLSGSQTVWALCGQYFASNFIFFFGLTWFFPQLMSRYGLSGVEASFFAAVPMIFGAIGNWTAGWWVDHLYARGQWKRSRRLPAMSGFLLAAIGIVGSAFAATPLSSSIWFSLCIFGADMTLSPSWSTCVDIGKASAGVVSGTMNMAGNIGSFVTSLAFPYLLDWTGSPLPFFYVAAVMCGCAIVLWLRIDPTRNLSEAGS